jgi:cytochrome c-type biogenesis protein CcmH
MTHASRTSWRLAVGLSLSLVVAAASAQQSATPVNDKEAYEIASQLRCVVCQNLSVADSPSDMAQQMRAIVRERLAMGETREQVMRYFVDRYGEWILLAPERRGFNLLVWLFPVVAVAAGLSIVVVMVTRWRRQAEIARPGTTTPVDASLKARIQRELDRDER